MEAYTAEVISQAHFYNQLNAGFQKLPWELGNLNFNESYHQHIQSWQRDLGTRLKEEEREIEWTGSGPSQSLSLAHKSVHYQKFLGGLPRSGLANRFYKLCLP